MTDLRGEALESRRVAVRLGERYLRLADHLLSGRIVGFYLVGSTALGEFRPGYSDVDFIAALDRALSAAELRRLRLLHLASGAGGALSAIRQGRSPLSGTRNGVFLVSGELSKPIEDIVPIASHIGEVFSVGKGSDVNPVVWKIFQQGGVALRGPEPRDLGLRVEGEGLRSWNLENFASYWEPWAEQVERSPGLDVRLRPRWWTAWGVLGAPRLHHTIATGEIVSKEAAGEYALATFDPEWHPIVAEGLAFRMGQPLDPSLGAPRQRLTRAARFVQHVAASARTL